MKFGKKRSNQKIVADKLPSGKIKFKPKTRTSESYRRELPLETEITDELRLDVDVCTECGEELSDKK